jgi:hypothetical protein
VRVILFVPAGVEPPAEYQQRIDEIANYTENFLRRGLARWGHRDAVMPIRRTADGHVEVEVMRGKRRTDDYKPVTLRVEVMNALRAQNRIGRQKQVWWILVYAGEPPARFDGFLGGFGEDIGGWATADLDMSPGRINPAEPLGSEFLVKLMLKGMLHELGHAFGLPHVGPLAGDDAGNTLMGPTHRNWRQGKGEHEPRVYLSEAEAAMLAMHPAFRGLPDDRGALPKLEVHDMKYAANPSSGRITVKGRVEAPERAIYALVADESEARPGEYWTKTYVGKVNEDGTFTVVVTEPAESGGTLKTWFIFEDGDHTGDGRRRGREGAISKGYTYNGRRWEFE